MQVKHTCLYGKRCKACKFQPAKEKFHKAQWPIWSDSLGVHPDQIPAAVAEGKRLGFSLEFRADGAVRVDSLQHQRELGKALGGYTDISKREITQPRNRTMLERSRDNPPIGDYRRQVAERVKSVMQSLRT